MGLAGSLAIVTLVLVFLLAGAARRVPVYEVFVEGAKEGFGVAVNIIPYLVAMLVAIGVFRAAGCMDYVMGAIGSAVAARSCTMRMSGVRLMPPLRMRRT